MMFREGQKGKIIDVGIIGDSLTFTNNVWLADGLKHKLLSICQFCDSGYDVLFNKNLCSVINVSEKPIVFKNKWNGNVYKINIFELTNKKVVCLLSVSDEKLVWHKRLGHANWRLISKISKLTLFKGLSDLDYHSDALCGEFQVGKINKTSFKSKNIISTSRTL